MATRSIMLMMVAVFTFNAAIAHARVSPALTGHHDFVKLLPKVLTDDSSGRGFCDLHLVRIAVGGHAFDPGEPFARGRMEAPCMLPVPPRDVFENIARAR
jgi:hypothetical protein